MSELLQLSQKLLQCKSITPADDGAMNVLLGKLKSLGFKCTELKFNDEVDTVINLYAEFGSTGKNLCFAGHTDVVPPGDESKWQTPPFAAQVSDDTLIARGAVDMKVAICCFVIAVEKFINENPNFNQRISFLITGDEEARSINGTKKVLNWLEDKQINIDHCLVGEPTNPENLGEMVKIGRRGSLTFKLSVNGIQGHIAYPQKADNPITKLVNILHELKNFSFDQGNEYFQPTNLEISTIDTGNSTTNLIPENVKATFNIRYNNLQSHDGLVAIVNSICNKYAAHDYTLEISPKNEAFICEGNQEFVNSITSAITKVTGLSPELSTTGGTSDARFIKDYCPVIEFGLISATAHKINEQISLNDMEKLSEIYYHFIKNYYNT